MTGPPIKSVAAHRGYVLRVEWRNGSTTLLNMRPRLQSRALARCGMKQSGSQ